MTREANQFFDLEYPDKSFDSEQEKEEVKKRFIEAFIISSRKERLAKINRLEKHPNIVFSDMIGDRELYFMDCAIRKGQYDLAKAESVLLVNWTAKFKDSDFYFPSLMDSVNTDCPTLSTVALYKGKKFAIENFLFTVVSDFITSFAVGKGTTSNRIMETVNDIYKDFHYFKLSEIKTLLREARKSMITYNAMDANKVYNLFADWSNRRLNETAFVSTSNHGTNVHEEKKPRRVEYQTVKMTPEDLAKSREQAKKILNADK